MLHFIRIACFMVLRDTGGGSFGASPSFNCFGVGSLVSLATIEKSENTNQDKNVIHTTCKNWHRLHIYNNNSFKIFPSFWLVKTTHIIHHNQLLFTKFGKNLRIRHIESITSKVEPSENYWTNDVKIFAILNQWRQKYSPPQLTEKTWGQGCVIFGERKIKERNGETPLRRRKYFEWIIKQLSNSAFVGYEEFCRSRRVLSTSAFGLCG